MQKSVFYIWEFCLILCMIAGWPKATGGYLFALSGDAIVIDTKKQAFPD